MANADQSRKNAAKLAAGVVFTSQTTNPVPTGSAGLWAGGSGSALKIVNMDGSTYAVGASGRTYKEACRLATAAALGTGTYASGVFTQTTAAVEQIDSVTVVVGDRVLVKTQSDGTQNGIYTVTVVGTVSVKQKLTRAADFDASGAITSGCLTPISEGSVNADTIYMLTTNAPITLDSTSLTFNLEPVAITYGLIGDIADAGGTTAAGVSTKVARADHVHDLVVSANASASGAANLDFSGSSGTFKTPSGAGQLTGTTNIAANKNLTCSAGTTALDLSLGTGVCKTPTGLLTYGGKQSAGSTVNLIADPGNAGAIPVTSDGVCAITTTGAETRTLAIPGYIGQRITISMDVIVTSCTITVATAYDSASHTTIAATAAGKAISLVGVQVAGVKAWRLAYNDGTTLG